MPEQQRAMMIHHGNKMTFCPRLWDEAYIDPKGDVYTCCHAKPAVLGNIYQTELHRIVCGKAANSFRERSLRGKLRCYARCTILDKEQVGHPPQTSDIEYGNMKRLKLMFGEQCNLNCVMCWQHGTGKTELDLSALMRHADLSPFEEIEVQGGEPLAIRSARAFFDYAAEKGKRISFLTNGTLIDDVWAAKISCHSSFVHVSLNAATAKTHEAVNRGSKWLSVLENIRRLRLAREANGASLVIIGHMTVVTKNIGEIAAFIRTYRQLGLDTISFGYDYKVPLYLWLHPAKAKRVRGEIRAALFDGGKAHIRNFHRLKLLRLV